ncbi:MAG: hypothetical protein VB124_03735, partial [Burkholderia sp.]
HLLEAKNRELSQEPELLTGVLDWLLGVNVNRSLARPIYATTPSQVTTQDNQDYFWDTAPRERLLPLALHAQNFDLHGQFADAMHGFLELDFQRIGLA